MRKLSAIQEVQLVPDFEGLSDAKTLHSRVYSYEAGFYTYGHYAVNATRYFTFIQFIHSLFQCPTLHSGKGKDRINFLLNNTPFVCPLHGHQHGLSGLVEQNVKAAFFSCSAIVSLKAAVSGFRKVSCNNFNLQTLRTELKLKLYKALVFTVFTSY